MIPRMEAGIPLAETHRREIERRRLAAKLPKVQLARLAGVDPSLLRSFLNRRWSNPSVGWLERIYIALDAETQ